MMEKLGKCTLINADCMEVMKTFKYKQFDLAIVDPNYGRREHGGKNRGGYVKQKNGSKIYVSDGKYQKRNWDYQPAGREYFNELIRVSKNQIVWGENYYNAPFGSGRIVWDKCNDGSDQSDCEIAYNSLTDRVDIFRFMWRGMFQGKSITEGTVQQGNKALNEKRIHPTQKPVALYKWLLQNYAKAGDSILDTHFGSLSIGIACHDLGFELTAIEKDEGYYNDAKKRLTMHQRQLKLF